MSTKQIKWTPHPWVVAGNAGHVESSVNWAKVAKAENVSDAHLIAAAPELVKALIMLMEEADDLRETDAFSVARAALAKARGEV